MQSRLGGKQLAQSNGYHHRQPNIPNTPSCKADLEGNNWLRAMGIITVSLIFRIHHHEKQTWREHNGQGEGLRGIGIGRKQLVQSNGYHHRQPNIPNTPLCKADLEGNNWLRAMGIITVSLIFRIHHHAKQTWKETIGSEQWVSSPSA